MRPPVVIKAGLESGTTIEVPVIVFVVPRVVGATTATIESVARRPSPARWEDGSDVCKCKGVYGEATDSTSSIHQTEKVGWDSACTIDLSVSMLSKVISVGSHHGFASSTVISRGDPTGESKILPEPINALWVCD